MQSLNLSGKCFFNTYFSIFLLLLLCIAGLREFFSALFSDYGSYCHALAIISKWAALSEYARC